MLMMFLFSTSDRKGENGFIMKLDMDNTNGAIKMSKSDKNNKGNDLGYRAK